MPDRPALPPRLDSRARSDLGPPAEGIGRIEARSARGLELGLEERDRRVRSLEARLAERDRRARALGEKAVERGLYATWLQSEIDRRDDRIGELLGRLDERSAEVARILGELEGMRSSRAWRVVSRLSRISGRGRRMIRGALSRTSRLVRPGRAGSGDAAPPPGPFPVAAEPGPIAGPPRESGQQPVAVEPPGRDPNAILRFIPPRSDPYDEWLRNNAWDAARIAEADRVLAGMVRRPLISVVVTMQGVEPRAARESLASLREQVYPDREVILVGGSEATAATIGGRAVVLGGADPDAFEAVRRAVDRAEGEYVVVVEGGARLAPDALLEYARAATEADEPADLIFSDEDRVDRDGRRFGPRFRPGWSPEAMLSQPAIGRTFAVRRSTIERVGGIRPEYGEAWSHDLALRLAEGPSRFDRIPRVLVHVPAERGGPDPIDQCSTTTISRLARALVDAVGRRGIEANVSRPDWAARERFPAFELDFPESGPRVTILIPTKDRVHLLRRCIDSVLGRTSYRDFEVVVIDDGSEEPETVAYLERLGPPCRVVRIEPEEDGFNYARIHNEAIESLGDDSEFVVFLNNDTEVRRPEWLSQLVGFGSMPGVGAVGARLLYADGRVQHAGILTDLYHGNPGHASRLAPWWDGGDRGQARLARNFGAVTAACMLVRRSTFRELGGFDEERFAVGYNDVDFCLRLGRRGLRCVYAPRAELFHFEGASRGFEEDRREAVAYRASWGSRVDPYHHPALLRGDERLGICTRRLGAVGMPGDRPLRLLLDVDRLDGTGNGRFVLALAEGLRDRGRVVPTIRAGRDGVIGDRLRELAFRVEIAGQSGEDRPIGRPWEVSEGEFELIHAVGVGRFEAIREGRRAGLPSIWTVRETTDFREAFGGLDEGRARAAIEAFSDAYRVTFPAWGVRRPYHPVEARWNYEVIAEDVPSTAGALGRVGAREALGIAPGARVLACLHDTEDRGAFDFLRAVVPLLQLGRGMVAIITAPDELLREMAREEAVRSMTDRIRLIPGSVDPTSWLAASDLLVCPSRRDLSPEAIGLGRALGLPMVLGEVPGIEEFARPGRDALVFQAGDVPAMRSKIERLIDDEESRRRLATAGGPVDRAGNMVAAFERLYREAIAVGVGRGVTGSAVQSGAA
jgi:GT2 family glycosyltransferase